MLRIYNSLTRSKEEFVPGSPGMVRMYVCGITAYDLCHVGHARAQIVFDIIYRYLKYKGYEVTYVRNFTDVDDKIIKKSLETGMRCEDVADKYITEFYNDMGQLGLSRPDIEPRVSAHIREIIELISILIQKGYAYQVDGDVYFEVKKFGDYGRLSGKKTDELLSGARVDVDQRKKDPLDFALWKSSKIGEPAWESPWGNGRPGWHIECSAMSMKYLGENFDIHGGGIDLLFPHHENERAQSESATGRKFVNYWVHNGVVTVKEEKMSKSTGNLFLLCEALKRFDAEALRLFILSSHYRSPLEFDEQYIRESERALERIYMNLGALKRGGVKKEEKPGDAILGKDLLSKFEESMDDDFNTPSVVAAVFSSVRALNFYKEKLDETLGAIDRISEVLGIFNSDPGNYLSRVRDRRARLLGINNAEIENLINEREKLRAAKDYKRADIIRAQLKNKGIILEDTSGGTVWRVESSD